MSVGEHEVRIRTKRSDFIEVMVEMVGTGLLEFTVNTDVDTAEPFYEFLQRSILSCNDALMAEKFVVCTYEEAGLVPLSLYGDDIVRQEVGSRWMLWPPGVSLMISDDPIPYEEMPTQKADISAEEEADMMNIAAGVKFLGEKARTFTPRLEKDEAAFQPYPYMQVNKEGHHEKCDSRFDRLDKAWRQMKVILEDHAQ